MIFSQPKFLGCINQIKSINITNFALLKSVRALLIFPTNIYLTLIYNDNKTHKDKVETLAAVLLSKIFFLALATKTVV